MTWDLTRRRFLLGAGALCVAVTPVGQRAYPQSYPTKPIHLLVGAAAGSTPDIVGRLVGEQLAAAVGQSVVVENRAGPGGIAAIQALAASAADGQTLALVTVNQAVFNSYLFSKLPYDPLQDIEPISLLASNSFSVGVQKSFGPNTFSELVAAAQAQPGKLAVGTAPPGTAPHVFAHVLARMIGIKMTFVPYRSGLEGITGLMRGDIQVLLNSPAVMVPQVKAEAIKILTVTGRNRERELPDVPTIAEVGFPAAEYESWFGLAAPSRTSPDVVARLNLAAAAILATPGIRQRFAAMSFEPRATTPEGFRSLIREEHVRWGPMIRDAGVRLD